VFLDHNRIAVVQPPLAVGIEIVATKGVYHVFWFKQVVIVHSENVNFRVVGVFVFPSELHRGVVRLWSDWYGKWSLAPAITMKVGNVHSEFAIVFFKFGHVLVVIVVG